MVEFEAVGISGHHEVIGGGLRRESKGMEESVFGEDTSCPEVDDIACINLVDFVVSQVGADIDGSLRDAHRY